ncbi:MAG: hypothetical protein WA628_05620 [Terriglobales bacterium]
MRYALGAVLLFGSCTPSMAQSDFPDHCGDGSPLPFASIEVKHAIDNNCGPGGKKTASANSKLQNAVKDNFCAGADSKTPEAFTPQMLVDLQGQTTIPSGFKKEPSDRQPLVDLGEGKLVRMKAFLVEAHHADLGAGETVNCNGGTEAQNDIHMAMGPTADAQECDSVSAEISPHYRPLSWNEIGHYERYNKSTRKYTPDPAMAARLQTHAYRITGQLFFDASHKVCPCGIACTPVRASLWEIHPVYAIDVCRSGTTCDENKDSDWLAFDTWWNSLAPLKKLKAPHSHGEQPH